MARKRLVKNILWMGLWQASNYLLPLLTFPYLTRALGVSAYGDFSFAFAVMSYLILVTDWGLELSSINKIAKDRDDTDKISVIFWNTLASRAALATLCTVAVVAGILIVRPSENLSWSLLAATSHLWGAVLTVSWCLQGLEKMGRFTTAAILGRVVTLPLIFLLVHRPEDAWIAALVLGAGRMVGGVISLVMVARLRIIRWMPVTTRSILAELSDSWSLFVSNISSSLYTNTGALFLGLFSGSAAVGIFSAAERLRTAAQSATGPISQAVYPHSSRLMHTDRAAGLEFARKLLVFQTLVCLAVSIGLFLAAEPLITVLAGREFVGAVDVLRILSPLPLLAGIANVLGTQVMIPLAMRKEFGRIMILVCVANAIIILPLIFRYGVNGAAAAAVISQILAVILMALAVRHVGLFSTARIPSPEA